MSNSRIGLTADQIADSFNDQVRDFLNEMRRAAAAMPPTEWEREFQLWQERNPLSIFHTEESRRLLDDR